jgi:hypothetical protein
MEGWMIGVGARVKPSSKKASSMLEKVKRKKVKGVRRRRGYKE